MSRQRTVRAGRGAIAGLLVAGWAAAGCDDVPGSFDQNDNALTASAPKVPADPAQTLGFEVPTACKVTGTGTALTTRTQGAAALQRLRETGDRCGQPRAAFRASSAACSSLLTSVPPKPRNPPSFDASAAALATAWMVSL